MSQVKKKYRPYLTVPQLQLLQSLLVEINPPSPLSIETEKYLRKYLRDIEEDFLAPNISVTGVKKASQDLGFSFAEILACTAISDLTESQCSEMLGDSEFIDSVSQETADAINDRYMQFYMSKL